MKFTKETCEEFFKDWRTVRLSTFVTSMLLIFSTTSLNLQRKASDLSTIKSCQTTEQILDSFHNVFSDRCGSILKCKSNKKKKSKQTKTTKKAPYTFLTGNVSTFDTMMRTI